MPKPHSSTQLTRPPPRHPAAPQAWCHGLLSGIRSPTVMSGVLVRCVNESHVARQGGRGRESVPRAQGGGFHSQHCIRLI